MECPSCERQYRVGIIAEKMHEKAFLEHGKSMLTNPAIWSLMPRRAWVESMNCLAFKITSRIQCGVQQLLVEVHSKTPIISFRLLKQGCSANVITSLPPCMLDELTAELLADHPSLSSEEFRALLISIALIILWETVALESRHASVRRATNATLISAGGALFETRQYVLQPSLY